MVIHIPLHRVYQPQNSHDVDVNEALQRLRARFKAATSMMGTSMPFELRKTGGELTF
jgi:hypothetical protein